MARQMTANEAMGSLRQKMASELPPDFVAALPPGVFQGIIEALLALFKQFCPALSPGLTALKKVAEDGLAAYENDESTRERTHLRRRLWRRLPFSERRNLYTIEGACWRAGAKTSTNEIVQLNTVWDTEKDSLEDSD